MLAKIGFRLGLGVGALWVGMATWAQVPTTLRVSSGPQFQANTQTGLITVASPYTVAQTVSRIEETAKLRGFMYFGQVDQAATARAIGIQMPDTVVIVLGMPRATAAAVLASPNLAFDLPQKVLVAQGLDGGTRVSFEDPQYLKKRYQVPDPQAQGLGGLDRVLELALGM